MFAYARGHYPLMANTSFASAKAEFEQLRKAKAGPATPTFKPTIGVLGTSASAEATAVGASSAAGTRLGPLYQQRHITRTVGQPFANHILQPGVPRLPLQSVSQSNPLPFLSNLPAVGDSSLPCFQSKRHGPLCYNHLPSPQLPFLPPAPRTRPFQKSPNGNHLGNHASTGRHTRSRFQFRHSCR